MHLKSNLQIWYIYINSICAGQDAELVDSHLTEGPVKSLPVCLPCLSVYLRASQVFIFLENGFDQLSCFEAYINMFQSSRVFDWNFMW